MSRLALFLDPGKSLDEAVERVRTAESLGYESVWVTHTVFREPLQVLALYAQKTERIGLGTGVLPTVVRHPVLTAMEAATLDEASGGRLILGLGISHRLTVEGWYGLTIDDPIGRMREYATVVRSMLTTGNVFHEGQHYTARYASLNAPRPGVRVVFAALAPNMLRLAAELADGVVLWMCSPGYIRDTVRPLLDQALAEHRRDPEDFDVIAAVPLGLTENPAGARDAFRKRALPYLQLPFYRRAIAAGGHRHILETFDEAVASGGQDAQFAAISDAFCDDYAAAGDRATLLAKLKEYREAGVTLPAVGPIAAHDGSLGLEATLEAVP